MSMRVGSGPRTPPRAPPPDATAPTASPPPTAPADGTSSTSGPRGSTGSATSTAEPPRTAEPSARTRADSRTIAAADPRTAAMRARVEGSAPTATGSATATGSTGSASSTTATSGPPVMSSTGMDISSAAGRRALLEATPQINDVSVRAGNSESVCGGAAMASAMVLDGHGAANAGAMRSMAHDRGVTVSREEETALAALEGGRSMSPRDMANLQQLCYRTTSAGPSDAPASERHPEPSARITAAGIDSEAARRGVTLTDAERTSVDALRRAQADGSDLSPADAAAARAAAVRVGYAASDPLPTSAPYLARPSDMAGSLAELQNNGGMPGATDVRFDEVTRSGPTGPYQHWTTTVGDTTADSMAPGGGASARTGGSRPDVSDRHWESTVALTHTSSGTEVINMDTRSGSSTTDFMRSQFRHGGSTGDWAIREGYSDRTVTPDPAASAAARTEIERVMRGRSSGDMDADDAVAAALTANPRLLDYASESERAWFRDAVGDSDYFTSGGDANAQNIIRGYAGRPPSLE